MEYLIYRLAYFMYLDNESYINGDLATLFVLKERKDELYKFVRFVYGFNCWNEIYERAFDITCKCEREEIENYLCEEFGEIALEF